MDCNVRPETMARITTPELAEAFIAEQVAEVRAQVGDKKVLLALSGGDGHTAAKLTHQAIGQHLGIIDLKNGILGGGCHALDMIRWMAGNPVEVTSYANRMMLKDWPTDDTSVTICRFPNGAIGRVFVSIGLKRNYTMRSCFYGTKGSIICDNTSDHLMLYRTDLEEYGVPFTTPLKIDIEPESHNTKAEILEFADIILNDKPVKTTAWEGSCTVALALAAVESNKIGGPVKVDYNF